MLRTPVHLLSALTVALIFSAACAQAQSAAIPEGTAIPVRFSQTIDSQKVKPGDSVVTRTMQVVFYGPVQSIPKGSRVLGHVISASYAGKDQSSTLEMDFDRIVTPQGTLHVCTTVRALASLNAVYDACSSVNSIDDGPRLGRTLVGGDHIELGGRQVLAPDGDDVGICNRSGVFSRLEPPLPGSDASPSCGSISTLQSVAVFSSRACGLYGFSDTRMFPPADSDHGIGLQSDHGSVQVHSGSAALLQVAPCNHP